MMHVELFWRELTDPPASFAPPREAVNSGPRGLTPPKLQAVDPNATHILPRVAAADVWLSSAVVNQRTDDEATTARAAGAPNSMRLWRESHQRALLALAREAAGVSATARCEAITWEQDGGEYHVTASFTAAIAPIH